LCSVRGYQRAIDTRREGDDCTVHWRQRLAGRSLEGQLQPRESSGNNLIIYRKKDRGRTSNPFIAIAWTNPVSSVAVPSPHMTEFIAYPSVSGLPNASKATSTPLPPVKASIFPTGSSLLEFTPSVAPISFAASSFSSLTSTAII